jgi:hypothetical protein
LRRAGVRVKASSAPEDLAGRYVVLGEYLPRLTVVGGCCGTDRRHVAAIASAWRDARASAAPASASVKPSTSLLASLRGRLHRGDRLSSSG